MKLFLEFTAVYTCILVGVVYAVIKFYLIPRIETRLKNEGGWRITSITGDVMTVDRNIQPASFKRSRTRLPWFGAFRR